MKKIIVLSSLILIIWYLIIKLEPSSGIIVLDEETIKKVHNNSFIQRVLWGLGILLQTFLCYTIYRIIPSIHGINKIGMKIFFAIVICSIIITLLIFLIGIINFK